jgi:Xaa-Pro aminopeptidase
LIAPKLYENELKESWVKNVILWKDEEDPYIKFKKIMLEKFREGEKLLIDDTIPASIILKAHNVLDKYNLNPLNPVIFRLRAIKDDE